MKAFITFLAAYTLSQFYRSFLAVIAPELAGELSLDPQRLANMQAWWIAGFVAMQFPIGWALDILGPRRTIAVSMLSAVLGAVLFAQAHTAFDLDLAMVLIGIGCSAIYMGAIFVFARVYPADHFALLCSWLLGIGTAGNLIAASPLAWFTDLAGWRNAMLGIAGATLISAIAILILIRDPPRVTAHTSHGFLSGIADVLKIRGIWPILPLTGISYAVMLAERGLWAGPYFSDVHGLEPVSRGNALLVMAIAMSAGAMAYGPLDRFFGTRKWIVATGAAVTAAAFIALGTLDVELNGAVFLMGVLGAFGMTYGVLMAHGRAFFPDHLLGRGITLMNVLFIGGAGILQPLSGALMTALAHQSPAQSYATLHLVFGMTLLAALAVYLAAKDMPPRMP